MGRTEEDGEDEEDREDGEDGEDGGGWGGWGGVGSGVGWKEREPGELFFLFFLIGV